MRFLSALLVLIVALPATAAEDIRTPYAQTLDQSNAKFLRELGRQVARAGFRNATVVPGVFLVRVEDDLGKPVMLLVNSDTLQATILEGTAAELISKAESKELEIPKLR